MRQDSKSARLHIDVENPEPTLARRSVQFSMDRKDRFSLQIDWDHRSPWLVVIGMNPSIADEYRNDPTVERCLRRAKHLGFGSLVMLNASPVVSTDPKGLRDIDPDTQLNRKVISFHIKWAAYSDRDRILCAWGSNPDIEKTGVPEFIRAEAKKYGVKLYCLGTNKDGSPKHPLYQPYSAPLIPWGETE